MATKKLSANEKITQFIQEAAQLRYPEEACGFVVRKGKKTLAVEVANEAAEKDRKNDFLINPDSFLKVEEEHGEIIGVWHTHVERPPIPTPADLAGCETSAMTWFLLSVFKRENGKFEFSKVVTFEPSGYTASLVGRPYVYGTFDCWSLVVDYLKKEHSIELSNNYPRLQEFWKEGKPMFNEHYKDEGLVQVENSSYQSGDVLMLQTDSSGYINHVGVYVGDGKFLHHVAGRLSSIDIYGGYWLKHTVLHLRHKSKCH